MLSHVVGALIWAVNFNLVAATPSHVEPALRVRNAPGVADLDTVRAIKRALSNAANLRRDTVLSNSTNIDKSWSGAVLYKNEISTTVNAGGGNLTFDADVEITCTTCYTKGTLTGKVSINGNFNATEAYDSFVEQFETEAKNLTETAWKQISSFIIDAGEEFIEDLETLDFDDFDIGTLGFPTIDADFNIDVQGVPEVSIQFLFDGLELYMDLETALSAGATYTFNLFTSETPIGYGISDELFLGIVLTVDIIMDITTEIDISSGFHILLDDGLRIDMELFSTNISNLTLPGGQFEFLPVTVSTSGGTLTAILRLGIHAGFDLDLDSDKYGFEIDDESFSPSAGIQISLFANLGQFSTSVKPSSDDDCELQVVEDFEFALGAAAGATIGYVINGATKTWGPQATTTTPIFYTTLASTCAINGTPVPTVSTAAAATTSSDDSFFKARDDLSEATTSTTIVFVGQACQSSGMMNCPVSLQSTTTFQSISYLTTMIPSGSTPTFSPTTFTSVLSTIAFGTNVKPMTSATGSPASYTPKATAAVDKLINGETRGVSNKTILGVSIGVGIPVLIAAITLCCCLCKSKKSKPVSRSEVANVYVVPEPYNIEPYTPEPYTPKKQSMYTTSSPDTPCGQSEPFIEWNR